jgi:hypothetical protein
MNEQQRAALERVMQSLAAQPEPPLQEPVAIIRWEMGGDGKLKQIDLPLTASPAQGEAK